MLLIDLLFWSRCIFNVSKRLCLNIKNMYLWNQEHKKCISLCFYFFSPSPYLTYPLLLSLPSLPYTLSLLLSLSLNSPNLLPLHLVDLFSLSNPTLPHLPVSFNSHSPYSALHLDRVHTMTKINALKGKPTRQNKVVWAYFASFLYIVSYPW